MRVIPKVVILAVLALLLAAASQASETNWRISTRAGDGAGGNFGPAMQAGAYPTSLDGVDPWDPIANSWGQDYPAPYMVDLPETCTWVTAVHPGDTRTWIRDIKSPASPASYPGDTKVWDLRVAALPNASYTSMGMVFWAQFANALPPQSVAGDPMGFRLIMVDNKGVPGAPANGRTWTMAVPTTTTAGYSDLFWSLPQDELLPIIKLSSATDSAMISEGYQLRFEQYVTPVQLEQHVVPEPTSLLALGSGLIGLAGLALRRRRR